MHPDQQALRLILARHGLQHAADISEIEDPDDALQALQLQAAIEAGRAARTARLREQGRRALILGRAVREARRQERIALVHLLRAEGLGTSEIARRMKVSRRSVCRWSHLNPDGGAVCSTCGRPRRAT